MELMTGVNDHGRRLDRILRKALPECPLPLIHRLLRKGLILVNGKPASAQTRVAKGSKIKIPRLAAQKIARKTLVKEHKEENKKEDVLAETPRRKERREENKPPAETPRREECREDNNKEFSVPRASAPPRKVSNKDNLKVKFYHPPEVLWQNQDIGLIAFNKPSGLAVHGQASLDRMVQAYLVNKLPHSLSFKPGPLHRLDKPSSGIVVFSTSLEGAGFFSLLMKEHKIKKSYLAVVEGIVNDKHFWTEYLVRDKEKKKSFIVEDEGQDKKGKIAITMAVPLATAQINEASYTLIEAEIETGRTHQIRAQSAFHGHPLAGDRKYGGHAFEGGFYLHAWKMEFASGDDVYKIEAPLPLEFKKIIDTVFGLSELPS